MTSIEKTYSELEDEVQTLTTERTGFERLAHELESRLNAQTELSNRIAREWEARLDGMTSARDRFEHDLGEAQRYNASLQREFDEFKQRVRTRMIAEAERRGWCREFDDILEEFGLEPRVVDHEVVVRFEGTFSRTVRAGNADRAEDFVYQELPFSANAVNRLNGVEVFIEDVSTDCVNPQR